MTPPVDIGKGLVVEGEAAEEDLGALIITNLIVISTLIKRHVCFSLKLGDECRGGVADGGEDGRVEEEMRIFRMNTADIVVEISRGFGDALNVSLKFAIS
ncbi:uncharacterized protein BcabD6B2_17210 [Babesia caballi]|uniref:Uncharacterized protein n=1 Tax=Babesia caballi TaxID=5871 RepID=A0AAV4LR17_BABCB|nr:hypothetical protein BcabD6B2_17210 [Babesia caballi]